MKKIHALTKQTHSADMTFDDLFEDISRDWQHKAQQLQVRRWQHIKSLKKLNFKYQG